MKLYQIRFRLEGKDSEGRTKGTLLIEAQTTEEAVKRTYKYLDDCVGIKAHILTTSVSKITEVLVLQNKAQFHVVKSNFKSSNAAGRTSTTPIYQLYMGDIDSVRAKHKELFDGLANEFELQNISLINLYDIFLYGDE